MDTSAIDNPYWDEVNAHVKESSFPWNGGLEIGRMDLQELKDGNWKNFLDRYQFVPRYAWTITDPASIQFVAKHSRGRMFDPMAGTGYWGYVLGQVGVDVACSDLDPSGNPWHGGNAQFTGMLDMDCAEAAARHPDRTMLLSWPPYSCDVGARALQAYRGSRIVYIGESHGGCTGDDEMHEMLNDEWKDVAWHRPVQWWGVRDHITVYDRK